uniref:Cupin-like domain-containing protein n=4 Tax=Rhodnius TaxID=13248 RepID=A0A4P6D9D4_RHOPR
MMKTVFGVKCVVPNNYLVWEATRPLADCSICSNLSSVIVLPNVTREEFKKYAYSYQPIIVKGAALHWPARKSFNYYFFKEIFNRIEGAHESVEEECQFLKFKTDFASLREVFKMPPGRVKNSKGYKPWYIGWSNCHPEVLKEMRLHYSKPHFLPLNAEHSHVDFIFMGYQQGAFMHLDYITRLMWQAQLRGHKTWRLNPPPECEMVCKSFSFEVFPGDILLLDTRQWYHDTRIRDGEFSITVSSEYG